MKNKVMQLLNNQKEARNVLAVEIINEAKALLMDLGCEHLLTNAGETIIKEIPVEVIKEIKVEVPVETIKEVKVEVPVEVIKEVPVEVVREVEVVKAVSSDEDKKTIKELNKEIKKINKALEYNKGVNTNLREKIKELKKTKPAVKEVPDTKALAEAAKEHSKIVMDLKNQIAAKDSIIAALNEKIKELEGKATKTTKKSNTKTTAKVEEPVNNNDVVVDGLQIIKEYPNHVIGRYNGVPFEAMKRVEGTNVYDPTKWDMKDEINQALVDAGYLSLNRDIKDSSRVECETGSCHEISEKKYMGYVVVNGVAHSYIFNTAYPNGYPSCVELNTYLADPTKAVRKTTTTKSVVDAINDLIAKHNAKANEVVENAGTTIDDLGISFVDTTTEPQDTTVLNTEVEEPVTNDNNTQEETVIEDTAINSESTKDTKEPEQEQAPQNDMVFVSFDEEIVFEGGEDIITTPPSYMGQDNSVDW